MQTLVAVPKPTFAACFDPADIDRLRGRVRLLPEHPYDELPDRIDAAWLAERLPAAEILITGWGTPNLTDDLVARAGRLRAIVHAAGTVKTLVPPAAFARNIAVTNTRYALARGVAETTLGLVIAAGKMFFPLARSTAAGQWMDSPWAEWILEPYRITVGIVGASEVGKRLLHLLREFELERIVYDPYADADTITSYGARKVSLDQLCAAADIICLCAPSTPETRHMIGRPQLALMKDRVRLINTARGALIDEAALGEELAKGRLFAILDVTDPEPPAKDSPLRTSPNCVVLPHIAGHAANGRKRQGRLAVDEILKFLTEGRFQWQVTPESLTRMA